MGQHSSMELRGPFVEFYEWDDWDCRQLCRDYKRNEFDSMVHSQQLSLLLQRKKGDDALRFASQIIGASDYMGHTSRKGVIDAIGLIVGIIMVSRNSAKRYRSNVEGLLVQVAYSHVEIAISLLWFLFFQQIGSGVSCHGLLRDQFRWARGTRCNDKRRVQDFNIHD
jgi:hypothetical protein